MKPIGFPFPALVGLEPLKLGLQLAAIDLRLSVLIRGDKGTGKSTAARGLVDLLAPGAPFVNLPIGATDDRLLGGLDVEKALKGEPALKPLANPANVPADLEGLRGEVQALRVEASDALRHLAVVRYDAFGDMGGHLSWSMALLDDGGNGVVLTSIHGRSEARTYAKNIATWSCDQAMSPEEEEAVKFARAG